mmetsp:Transcript_13089/g.26581  ORF Transcript_13089/g.26581 Transcript_13089/m.26581 type:complete len:298 (-) Transcript_13089:342-1235(-)
MDRPRRSARKRAHDAADTEQQEQEQATRGLIPTEEDIILGRGVKHVGKTGNARYYELLDWFLPAFDAADTKGAKTAIVRSIYDQLQNGGARFLKYDTRSGYYSIDPRHGKKKISHALRYRKRHQQDGGSALEGGGEETDRSEDNDYEVDEGQDRQNVHSRTRASSTGTATPVAASMPLESPSGRTPSLWNWGTAPETEPVNFRQAPSPNDMAWTSQIMASTTGTAASLLQEYSPQDDPFPLPATNMNIPNTYLEENNDDDNNINNTSTNESSYSLLFDDFPFDHGGFSSGEEPQRSQ